VHLGVSALILAALSTVASMPALGVEAEDQQHVVITLQQDPLQNLEASCVGIQIGMSQLALGSQVTLFPTLAGVGVVNNEVLDLLDPETVARPGRGRGHAFGLGKGKKAEPELCLVGGPNGTVTMPLGDLLDAFVGMGGKIVVCPLCWFERYPETAADPAALEALLYENAEMGASSAIPMLFYEANKVIDY
jgi:hypothetical protein